METISKWLERVADKDPALFQTFINKMNAAQPKAAKKATKDLVQQVNGEKSAPKSVENSDK